MKEIIVMLMASFFCSNLAAVEVVRNAHPQAVIVVAEKPSETAAFAASELQKHIEKATGVLLQIVKENETIPSALNKIYIGETQRTLQNRLIAAELPGNSYRIKIDKDEVFLYGRDGNGLMPKIKQSQLEMDAATGTSPLGTLYAVYDLLDREMGVKWIWPGELGTYVPHTEHLDFVSGIDRTLTPRLLFSRIRIPPAPTEENEIYKSYLAETRAWFLHHRLGKYSSPDYGHAFTQYWKRFGKTHPEWFALKADGTRGPLDQRSDLVQMCVSNPELHKQIVADWLENRTPDKPWINCMENDKRAIDQACSCKNCQAWDSNDKLTINDQIWDPNTIAGKSEIATQNEISLSDRYAKFYLAVQEEAKKYDKNAQIAAGAYSGYTQPPINTSLNGNINIRLTAPYYFPLSPADKDIFSKLWDGWRKTGARLILRPNYFYGGYCMTYIFAEEFGKEFKYALLGNDLIGTDFDCLTSMWSTQGPNLYMLGRLHARPDLTLDQVMDEYYSAFGKGKESIRNYFSHWNDITAQNQIDPTYGEWTFKYADKLYTLRDIQKGKELLDQARLAAGDDKEAVARVDFLAKGLEHARLVIDAIKKSKSWREHPFDIEKTKSFEQALDVLYEYRKKIDGDLVINSQYCQPQERLDFIGKSYFDMMLRTCAGRMPLDNWQFKWQQSGQAIDMAAITAESSVSWSNIAVDKSWAAQVDKIGAPGKDDIGWYRTEFKLPDEQKTPYSYVCIMFGGVDKSATVWLNGEKKLERVFYSRFDPDMWQSPFFIIVKKTECKPDNSLVIKVQGRIQGGGIWKSVDLIWFR
jgi:hypothetical protein